MFDVALIDGRYELVDIIASGGMATVWRARDARLDRLVAVKRPHPSAADDDSIPNRMRREARLAAAINHPNLITVYDYGSDDQGPYLVMELAEGPTLRAALDQLDTAEALEIGAKIAEGLAAIHAGGIVHRDVKPANVILSDRGPLLTDFGIALDPTSMSEVTAEGMIVATPSYAAPEVMAGEPPTKASDVYSLGIVVRELLEATGTSPDSPLAGLLDATTADAPASRPDARSVAALLRAQAPTVTLAPNSVTSAGAGESDPTLVMKRPPTLISPRNKGPDRGRRKVPLAVVLVCVLALLFVAGLAISSGSEPRVAADPAPPATTQGSTTFVSTSTTVSTSPTQAPTTTVSAPTVRAQESRDRLEAVLLQPPRSDLNRSDVEKLMEEVDHAIDRASVGDSKKAMDEFEKVAEDLDEKLENGNRDAALAELERLIEILGLRLGAPDEDGD